MTDEEVAQLVLEWATAKGVFFTHEKEVDQVKVAGSPPMPKPWPMSPILLSLCL